MTKGDIVLIPFPFTDLSGQKNRPAIVLIDNDVDVTVCFLTTQLKWHGEFDIVVEPSSQNGLKRTSLVRLSKLATLDKEIILGRLGTLESRYIGAINQNLIQLFQL